MSKSVWQHLLKAPSKGVLTQLCHQAILYKGLGPDLIPQSVVAEWSSKLSITKGETKQVVVSLSILLQQAVFVCASDSSAVSTCLPSDFPKDLGELISSIVIKNFPQWKAALNSSNSTLPRLVDVKCRVDNSGESMPLDILPTTQANCMLQLKIQDHTTVDQSDTRTVNVQLSKEKLKAMLDGLSKIKNQLTSVTQR